MSQSSMVDTSKPTHFNIGGTIKTIIPDDFIKCERETETLFSKLFSHQSAAIVTPTIIFTDPVYYIDCPIEVFNQIYQWIKFGLYNKELSNYQRTELINGCKVLNCNNLMNILMESQEKKQGELTKQDEILSKVDSILETIKFSLLKFPSSLNFSNQNLDGIILDAWKTENKRKIYFTNSSLIKAELKNSELNADFSKCNLSNSVLTGKYFDCDFRGAILDGAKLNAEFSNCDFTGASLKTTNLSKAVLNNCQFDNFKACKLDETNFESCNFYNMEIIDSSANASFDWCSFKNAKLKLGLTLRYCTFENSEIADEGKGKATNCTFKATKIIDVGGDELYFCTFTDVYFSGIKRNTKFTTCTFTKSSMKGLSIFDSIFDKCKFDACDMSNSTFNSTKIEQSTFISVKLTCAVISNTSVINSCDLKSTTLSKSAVGARMHNCRFSDSILNEIQLSQIDECIFNNCELESSKFERATITSSSFNSSKMSHCKFSNTTLKDTSFSETNINRIELVSCSLWKCSFSSITESAKCYFCKTSLTNCSITESDLPELIYSDVILEKCNLIYSKFCFMVGDPNSHEGINFNECNLKKASFCHSELQQSSFINCDLSDTDFTEAVLGKSSLKSKIQPSTKIFNYIPDTFDSSNISLLGNATSNVNNATFESIHFNTSYLTNRVFVGCGFMHSSFSSTPENVVFTECYFYQCSFNDYFFSYSFKESIYRECKLNNCHFPMVEMLETTFSDCEYQNPIIVDQTFDLLKSSVDAQKLFGFKQNRLLFTSANDTFDNFRKLFTEESTKDGFIVLCKYGTDNVFAYCFDKPIGKETDNCLIFDSLTSKKSSTKKSYTLKPNTDSSHFITTKPSIIDIPKKGLNEKCCKLFDGSEKIQISVIEVYVFKIF